MAEEHQHHDHHIEEKSGECKSAPAITTSEGVPVETTDRGLFDFLGGKKEEKKEEEVMVTEFEKVKISEPEVKSLSEKLNHSGSSSSSSSDEEEEEKEGSGEKKKKKKKGLKEMIAGEKKEEEEEKKHEKEEADTSVPIPIEKYEEEEAAVQPDEKKGFLDKIKEKLPGQHKRAEEVVTVVAPPPPPPAVVECYPAEQSSQGGQEVDQPKEKKGFLEKIKEKIPGYHPKSPTSGEEEKEKEKEKD